MEVEDERPVSIVDLACGHSVEVKHISGDRGIACPTCGVASIVSAYRPQVAYRVRLAPQTSNA